MAGSAVAGGAGEVAGVSNTVTNAALRIEQADTKAIDRRKCESPEER